MTAIRVVRLWCDHRFAPGAESAAGYLCGREFTPGAGLGWIKSMRVMRAEAAKAGWTYVPYPDRSLRDVLDKDYCPGHKPEDAP